MMSKQLFDERKLNTIFGGMSDHGAAAYILFYEKVDHNRKTDRSLLSKYQVPKMTPLTSTVKGKQ